MRELQKTDNYYYASFCFDSKERDTKVGGLRWVRFVVFADSKSEAERLARAYALSKMETGEKPFSLSEPLALYRKNYIFDSRKLVKAGLFTGKNPLIS